MTTSMSTSGFSRILDGTEKEVAQTFGSTVTVTEQNNQTIVVSNGATDQALSLGPVADATGFTLETDETITIKLNGSSDAITVNSILVLYGSVTAITVSNASGSDATLKVMVGGA